VDQQVVHRPLPFIHKQRRVARDAPSDGWTGPEVDLPHPSCLGLRRTGVGLLKLTLVHPTAYRWHVDTGSTGAVCAQRLITRPKGESRHCRHELPMTDLTLTTRAE
jgi:hypothetical protein